MDTLHYIKIFLKQHILPVKTEGWSRSQGVFLRKPKEPLKPLRG